MSKRRKKVLIGFGFVLAVFAIFCFLRPEIISFASLQTESLRQAGTWEDDAKNWYRAFGKAQPKEVKVIHSKYWKSSHFTDEHVYFFEVEASPEWTKTFLKNRGLQLTPPAEARSFRTQVNSDLTPTWFAPDPVENYEVWDVPAYFGSVWMNKTNGHIHFYAMQL